MTSEKDLLDFAHSIIQNPLCPRPEELLKLVNGGIAALSAESLEVRPCSFSGEPGGLVRISTPFVAIVPDLHARYSLLYDLLASIAPSHPQALVADLILNGELTIVCLGDVFHTEGRLGAKRWMRAARKIEEAPGSAGILSEEMEVEMGASLTTLSLVIALKRELAGRFHCLKGNHDNCTNSSRNGDSAFYKYALEGAMGAEWFRLRYGDEIMLALRNYERLLPLIAVGGGFCASHAEPAFSLGLRDVLEYRERPDIVRALIWTSNGEANEGSVEESLTAFLEPAVAERKGLWISGHRPVAGSYALRAGGRLVQIHNPERRQVAWIDNSPRSIGTAVDIYEIGEKSRKLSLLERVAPFRLDQSAPRH